VLWVTAKVKAFIDLTITVVVLSIAALYAWCLRLTEGFTAIL